MKLTALLQPIELCIEIYEAKIETAIYANALKKQLQPFLARKEDEASNQDITAIYHLIESQLSETSCFKNKTWHVGARLLGTLTSEQKYDPNVLIAFQTALSDVLSNLKQQFPVLLTSANESTSLLIKRK